MKNKEKETMIDNQKKVALVTGGSRGIGRAIAISLSDADIFVALTYNTKERQAKEVVKEITSKGGTAIAVQMKIEDRKSIKRGLDNVRRIFDHPVDILVNNAAIAQEKPFLSITGRDWDMVMAVNLRGAVACAQEVLPDMIKKGWGRIINIASIGGQWGGFNQVHYAASKAGLISLTRSIAKIYSKYGITSNAVSPGIVETEMIKNELKTKTGKEKVRDIPIGRIAAPEEIARVVVFLAGDDASYITGQTINVNGGMYFG